MVRLTSAGRSAIEAAALEHVRTVRRSALSQWRRQARRSSVAHRLHDPDAHGGVGAVGVGSRPHTGGLGARGADRRGTGGGDDAATRDGQEGHAKTDQLAHYTRSVRVIRDRNNRSNGQLSLTRSPPTNDPPTPLLQRHVSIWGPPVRRGYG
jgi:hypothetical protein